MSPFSASQTRAKANRSADVVRRSGTASLAAQKKRLKAKGQAAETDVRKHKVERAKKLIHDPNYPSEKIIKSVASLLARNLKPVRGTLR